MPDANSNSPIQRTPPCRFEAMRRRNLGNLNNKETKARRHGHDFLRGELCACAVVAFAKAQDPNSKPRMNANFICRKKTQRTQRAQRRNNFSRKNLMPFSIQNQPVLLCVLCVLSRPTSVFRLDVGCWMLDVRSSALRPLTSDFRFPPFAFSL